MTARELAEEELTVSGDIDRVIHVRNVLNLLTAKGVLKRG